MDATDSSAYHLVYPVLVICFQAKIDEIFSDMHDSTQGIADDILVIGFDDDSSDHDAALDAVCAHVEKVNLCFNEKKCIIHCTICTILWLISF